MAAHRPRLRGVAGHHRALHLEQVAKVGERLRVRFANAGVVQRPTGDIMRPGVVLRRLAVLFVGVGDICDQIIVNHERAFPLAHHAIEVTITLHRGGLHGSLRGLSNAAFRIVRVNAEEEGISQRIDLICEPVKLGIILFHRAPNALQLVHGQPVRRNIHPVQGVVPVPVRFHRLGGIEESVRPFVNRLIEGATNVSPRLLRKALIAELGLGSFRREVDGLHAPQILPASVRITGDFMSERIRLPADQLLFGIGLFHGWQFHLDPRRTLLFLRAVPLSETARTLVFQRIAVRGRRRGHRREKGLQQQVAGSREHRRQTNCQTENPFDMFVHNVPP